MQHDKSFSLMACHMIYRYILQQLIKFMQSIFVLLMSFYSRFTLNFVNDNKFYTKNLGFFLSKCPSILLQLVFVGFQSYCMPNIFFITNATRGVIIVLSVHLLKPLCQETLLVFSYRTQCVYVHIPRNFLFLSFSSWNCGSSEPFIIENNTEHSFSVHLFLKHCTEFFFVGSKDTICKYAYIRKF